LLLVIVAALAPACAVERRAVVVEGVDIETRLAVEACTTVEKTLGKAQAARLLEGHILRPGQRVAVVVREWEPSAELPARRVTIAVDPEALQHDLPSPGVALRADRASADGTVVKDLTVEHGVLWLARHTSRIWRVHLEMTFAGGEPPIYLDMKLGWRSLDATGPRQGRANPIAMPEEYVKP
jgi:hypothetical protein